MMSDPHRRRSPESSRRRRKSRRDSRDREQEQSIIEESTSRRSIASNTREGTTFSTTTGGLASSYYPSQPSQFAPSSAAYPVQSSPIVMRSSEPTPRAPSSMPIPTDLNRPRRVRRHGSRSSLDSSSASSSSSSSYLDISRWYPSWGRGGGVLKTFFKTPSEHYPRRRRSQRKMHKKNSKKTKGVFVFGNNSSSSSVNSDMAYGMGFIKKPKSRGGGFSPNMAAAAASVSGRERSEGRPGMQRRQTDEEIREIGRKLQDVARLQNRADLDRRGKTSWESYQRHSSSGVEVSSRGLAPSKHDRRHRHASSSDDEWESASEGEDSDGLSALAYGNSPVPTPRPAKSSASRMSTASAIAAGSALVAGSAIAASTVADRKSTVVDPKLFGPTNSLRDHIHTPCGFNDDDGVYNYPRAGLDAKGYAGSAESASAEARPLQRVFPLQTSDPGHVEAARATGSVVSSQQNYSSVMRDRTYSNTSVSNRPEPVPIQAPKPIAPVPSRIYNDERIRDASPETTERRRSKPTSDNKIYAETALVGAGVAALGAAILAGRDKGKGKEDDQELKHGKHERYGHDDHRQDDTKVEDARKAQELRLMQEIERLEKALGKTNKAREQRRRDSKRDRDSGSFVDSPADERRKTDVCEDDERDYERERDRRRRDLHSKRDEPSEYDSRVSDPSERLALVEDDTQHRRVGDPGQLDSTAPIDVFQFQVPDDAFTTGTTPPKAPSPIIIDVTPSPSPAPEQRRESRRGSLAEETRDAHKIYEEAHHSTAPIPEAVMAAAIGAVAHSRRHEGEEEEGRGRTNARIADTIQEEANKFYAARRVAEREIRSRSRSKSREDPAPRIVTPPEMQNRPPKNPFSGANADFRFDKEMSPTQLLGYWPEVAPVRDPSAERPRPVLNLVMPTPAPTPEPERQNKVVVAKEPEPVEEPQKEVPSVVFGPRGEVVEVYEEPPTPSTSKRVSWGPSETKQYEEHSPERSRESSPEEPRKGFGGWGAIAAAVTGAGVGAALAHDQEPKSPRREERSRDEYSSGSRSPPKERPVLPKDMSSRVLTEEPEELPPAPGPKPASPRNLQQMPGSFSDDIDFAATLAAGLEHSGFDPDIVIDNPEYHRRDSPPGSNAPYTQPFAETVSDLGIYSIDDGYSSVSREPGYVIGEVDTPGSEKAAPLDDFEDVSRGKSNKDKRSSSVYDDIEVIEEPEEAEPDTSKLSKNERRKLEKAAQAAKMMQEEVQAAQPQAVEAGDDEWAETPTSKKSKKSKKSKRSSVAWDDADTPINDARVSVPVNAFDDIKDNGTGDYLDDWDTPKKSKKSKRDSKGYELAEDDSPDREKRDHRRAEFYEPSDRDVASVVSDSRYDKPSNGHSNGDDDRSVVSAPSSSKRDSKRSSGGFWGLLGGKEQQQSKKDKADTLGAGVGLAGVAAVAMAAAVAGSDAASASPGHKEQESYVERSIPREAEVFEDPEIAPRVIKPAIDPQYGDLLPLPPSPGESSLEFDNEDTLPALPDSRPTTPPGQAPAVVRERESSIKRPAFASHNRRTSTAEAPLRSPSHTAIPIQFRMGHRSVSATSPAIGSRSSPVVQSPTTPTQSESPPTSKRHDFSPTFRRQPPRPTSWDSSREIKPLYLLERSARPAVDEEHHNEAAEITSLPTGRQSPVPEDNLKHEQAVGLGGGTSPLVIDTDLARSADSGSQEPTPTGQKLVEAVPSLEQEVETTPLGFPSSSTLPESSYATPGEFPREVETVSPPRLEPIATEAQDVKEVNKPEKQSYFPSALSMLPAATLAGVGVLLGRGKKDEAHASGDDVHSKPADDESLSKPAEPLTETAAEPASKTSRLEQKELAEPESELVAESDAQQEVSESPASRAIDLQSPADFEDAQSESLATASPNVQEAAELIPEAPIDTTSIGVPIGSKKKKKKGKKKQSLSDAPQRTTTADEDILASSNAQEDISVPRDADLKTAGESSTIFEPSMASTAAAQTKSESPNVIVMRKRVLEQLTPSQPDDVEVTAESEFDNTRDLGTSQQETRNDMDPSFLKQPHDSTIPQPVATSEEALTQVPGQDKAAENAPVVEDPRSPELRGIEDEALALPIENEQTQRTDMLTESDPREMEPVADAWATPSSKKRSKKKKRQSVGLAEDTLDSPLPISSGDKTIQDVQEPSLSQNSPDALGLDESPREQLQEPLEHVTKSLDPDTLHDDVSQQDQVGSQDVIEEPAVIASTGLQADERPRDIPAGTVPIPGSPQTDKPKFDASQVLVEEPSAKLLERQESQQEVGPIPISAEEEYPIISKKSKKNKKRKGSKAIDEPTKSSVIVMPTDSEQVDLPVDAPQQSAPSAVDDLQATTLPSESTGMASESTDVPTGIEAARSPSSSNEAVRSSEVIEDRTLSAQQDNLPTGSALESQEISASPILVSHCSQPQPDVAPIDLEPLDASTDSKLEADTSKSLESEVDVGHVTQPINLSPECIALPVEDDSPTKTSSPSLEQGSFKKQDLQEASHEGEGTGHEESLPTTVAQESDLKQQEDIQESLNEEEAARREAEAVQIQEEEAELARLKLKRKPSKRDKSRLKDLKARAQQRAEEAEATASSFRVEMDSEQPSLEPEVNQASELTQHEPTEPIPVEEEDVPEQSGQIPTTGSTNLDSPSDIPQKAGQVVENPRLAGDAQVELPLESRQLEEDPEELARREAEAEKIRDEESELVPLKIKEKPSKKDKTHIKVLQANAEEREREAEAAAQRQAKEQAAVTQDTQDEAHVDLGQDTKRGLTEETPPAPSVSVVPEDDIQHQIGTPVNLAPEDNSASDVGNREQPNTEMRSSNQQDDQIAQDLDEPQLASSEASRLSEHLDSKNHESITQEQPASLPSQDNYSSPPALDQIIGTSEGHPSGVAEDTTEQPPSSSKKPKSTFGGWGVIAAAVTGASIGTALGTDGQSETPASRDLEGDHNTKATDEVRHLDSHARGGEDETIQEELRQDTQPHAEAKETGSGKGVIQTDTADPSPARVADAASIMESNQQDMDISRTLTDIAPEPIAATEVEPDSEWSVPVKKSKKDKKKKRKGTMSGDTGITPDLATPLEANATQSILQSVEVGKIDASASQKEDILPVADREIHDLQLVETLRFEQHDNAADAPPQDALAEDVAPSNLEEVITETQENSSQEAKDSGAASGVDVAQTAAIDEAGSGSPSSGQRAPLGETMDLPPSLVRSEEAAPPTEEPDHAFTDYGSVHASQNPSKGSGQFGGGTYQPTSSADESAPVLETNRDLPLETEPSSYITDEPQQLQDEEIYWAPAKKKDKKKKKKRGSVAWSEPANGTQVPIGEKEAESSTQTISQQTSKPTESLAGDGRLSETRESDPQLDDWSPVASSQEKQASMTSLEQQNIPLARLDDETRETRDDQEVAQSSGSMETVTQPTGHIHSDEALQQESRSVPEQDLTIDQEDATHFLAFDNVDQSFPIQTTQPGALENLSFHEPVSKSDLKSQIEEGEDTIIVTGGNIPDSDLPLTSEVTTSQPSVAISPPATMVDNSQSSESTPKPDVDSQSKHINEFVPAADEPSTYREVPVASEQSVVISSSKEPISRPDLDRTVDEGEETLIVAGGKVADEVAEPWAFEATHDSPSITKSDLDNILEDGDDTMVVAGGKTFNDTIRPPHVQNDGQDGGQMMNEPATEFLDIDRPTSRPQSPAPWGDDDYSTSSRHMGIGPFSRRGSPDPKVEDETILTEQNEDLAVQRSIPQPEFLVPSDDENNSAFVTPFEEVPVLAAEASQSLDPDTRQDSDEPFEGVPTKRSKKDKKNTKSSITHSLDLDPEPSTAAPETPTSKEAADQQSSAEVVEAPGVNGPVSDKTVEPATEDLDDWTPKKLTKKEKRKTKKSSISISDDRQVSTQSLEEQQPEFSPNSPGQTPKGYVILGNEEEEDPAQTPSGHLGQPAEVFEPNVEPDFSRSRDVGGFSTDLPDSPSQDVSDEPAKIANPEEVETSIDHQTEPLSSTQEVAEVAAAAAVPVLTRKMSKKEKRKAKKATSSWEDDTLDASEPQASAVEDLQTQEVSAVASSLEDNNLTRETAQDVSLTKSQPDQDAPVDLEASTPAEAIPDDEWAAPVSRKKSKGKKNRGKQLSLDWISSSQAPAREDLPPRTSGEDEDLSKFVDDKIQETVAHSADSFSTPTSPPRPDPVTVSEVYGSAHLEARSPATLGTDLQKVPSAAPSPDPWESEDYFKPKTASSSPTDPPEEPFGKFEVHPAFTRGLNTAPGNRNQDERPLVGLGLIHRHSSIFQEDDGHTPKLLTLTSDNASIESLAIEETSQAAQESTVSSSSAHPQRRFPLSPKLSPSRLPEEPPKSPIPEEIKLSQRGSVAKLAQRFGGKRKKISKFVDKRAPVADDVFDDPSMWEGAERKAVEGSRMDDDAGDFWAVEDEIRDEISEPDEHPGQGSTSPAHSMGTKHGDDNVSATHSTPGPDAGRFTPELSGKATREEEVPLEPLVESPILGSQASNHAPSPEPQHTALALPSPPSVEPGRATHRPANIADTWDLIGAKHQKKDLPSARSASPASDTHPDLEESALPSNEVTPGESPENFIPAIDFRRSVSRGLPPVQEETSEEEAELGKHTTSLTVTTPDINRDSGFVTDSPNLAWTRRFDDAQQRDSGVHLRDSRDRSPGLHSSRGVSPDPNRVSRSSVEAEGAGLDEQPKRSPLANYERRLREDTPVLEAQEPPVTPEPQKSRSDGSRTHKYPDLGPGATTAAALAGGAAQLAAQKSATRSPSGTSVEGQRSVSDSFGGKSHASTSPQPDTLPNQRRALSNTRITRAKTPEPLNLQPESPSLLRHSGTPPLRSRRTRSGDLRTLSQSSNRSVSDLGSGVVAGPSPASGRTPTPAAAANTPVPASSSSSSDLRKATTSAASQTSTANPVANEGRLRSKDMADVYDGFGEGRLGSPRSPTRPHSMRRRQSMQVLDLENRVEQLMAENRALAEAKAQAEQRSSNRVTSSLADRDNEIEALKQSLDFMRKEIHRLTEVNEGLNSAISQSAVQHQDQYRLLETQHAAATGELANFRSQHGSHQQTIEEKDAEIRSLREQLDATKEQVRELQKRILATNPADSDFLRIRDVDYFDHRCQQLCSHVQQWVLRFSKFSDMRACRLTTELNDEKIIDRLDNAVLDGSNVDSYLNDRVRRRDVFMSVAMTMIWDFVFTRYLFGMDREQRQKLKALEKLLLEVGPPKAVRQWRAVTLTLLSQRDAFKDQREQDTEAVVQAVFQTLSMILPPPSNLEDQIQSQLRKVMREAVDLSIEMRTQRAEYMMLPPLQPEYDASGDLAEPHPFNAQLMSERSGDKSNDDDLQAEGAIVRLVLFPLVVKKGDDEGVGDDEVVVCPAQVIVKKPRSSSRRSMRAPSSDAGGVSLLRGHSPSTAPNRSNVSMAEAEYIEGGI